MHNLKKYSLLCLILVSFCSVKEKDNDGDKTPERTPIKHSGIIEGQQLEIFGQAKDIKLSSLYGKLSKELVDNTDPDPDMGTGDGIIKRGSHLDSAGFYIAFETDADTIVFNFKLRKGHTSSITPDPNESGFDLLKWNGSKYEFEKNSGGTLGVGNTVNFSYDNTSKTESPPKETDKYILLFPSYNGLANTEEDDFTITIPEDAKFYQDYPYKEDKEKPILIYGTSVSQGASATLPSKIYTTLLSSKMEKEVLNLGFAGRAFMYTNMADYLATIPSSLFIIETALNIKDLDQWSDDGDKLKKDNATYLIKTYRENNPDTPIVVLSQFRRGVDISGDTSTEGYQGEILKDVVETLESTVGNLYFISRVSLDLKLSDVPDDVHPSDTGMKKWASHIFDFIIEKNISLDD